MRRYMALAALASWSACHHGAPRTQATVASAPAPASAPAAAAPAAETGYLGVVVAPQTVDVTSQLSGRLLAVLVRVGDRVEKQGVLARLDGRSAAQDLAIARAELLTAEATRDEARLDVAQAAERLARRSAVVQLPSQTVSTVSQEELAASHYQARGAEVKLAAAEAAVAQKRARLLQMQLMVKEGVLRAPFAGVVVARYVDGGGSVRQGSPVVRLLETGALRVRFAMPEDADDPAIGTPVRVTVAGEPIAGAIEKVAPEIDAASRMIFAEASLARPRPSSHPLRSGQVARVTLAPAVASAR
jgi:RND family efflux transporter MFP subunit